ncbi:MAG: HYR domain-containing protein, partial [Saprospiraceae bacterium]
VTVAGIYTLTVRSTTNGCATTATATVASNTAQPSASASAAGVLTCSVTSAQLSGSSATPGATFSWTGPGGFSSNLQNPTATAPGTYVLTVRDPLNGCSATATAAVSQNIVFPAASATGSALTCTNATGQISASTNVPNATFSWSGPNSFGTHTASATVNVGGIYTVIITNPVNGCTNSAFANVVENRTPPVADAGDDRRLNCHASIIQIQGLASSVGANFSYQWTTLTGNILSGANTLSPRFNAPGTYYLKITNTQNGCTAEDEMDVFLSLPVTAAAAQVNSVSCFGTPTGSAKATPGGGLAPYTYKWSNNAVSANVGGLVAGVYTVTVTDADGCTASSSTTIAQPTALQATATATPQTQMGVNNGTATVVPTGGTSPYSVAWSNTQTTTTISNLAPGNYTVTVTDAKNCTIARTANVSPLNCTLSGTVGITPVSCTGGSNGSATVSLNGANGTITYAWSSGAQTATATNLAAGFYTVTATDAAGCRVVLDAQLLEPQAINLSVVSKTDVGCPDVAGGAITIGAAGGTSPYMSTWSNGQTGVTLNNLMPGTYTVTVTDAKGCTQTLAQQIAVVDANPPVLVLKNATATLDFGGHATVSPDIFDNGSTDAECSIASWTVSPSTFDCSKVGSQTVTVTATDRNGNVATGTTFVEILDETPPVLTCPGDIFTPACSSVVSFNLPQIADNCPAISDPTLEDGFPAGSSFPVGTTVQVFKYTDGGGQTATCSFAVTVMPAFDVDLSVSQTACAGACDGNATVQNAAGFASILWSNGQSGDAATGLCAGDHFVTVTDASGCAVVETVNISAQTGAALAVSADVVAANCATGCDGSATLQIAGGTAPFNFAWSNGQASSTATGLCAGNYTATVTDARGCSQTQSVGIVAVDNQLPTLTCPSDIATGACQPGVTFGLPQVSDNCATDPAQIVQIAGLAAGAVFPVGTTVQIFRYTDGGGNVAICSFNVTVHAAPNVVTTAVASCFEQCDGRAMANGFGGLAPLDFQWSNGQTSETAQNLCPGIFTVTVTDASGCSATGTATVQQPAAGLALAVDNVKNDAGGLGNGSIQVTPTGGTPPYLFSWTKDGQPFATTEDLSGLFAGQYRMEITDANGCTLSGNTITVQTVVSAGEAAGDFSCKIYPNPASDLAVLEMSGLFSGGFSVEIFDAAGKLLSRQVIDNQAKTLALDLTECPDGLLWVRVSGAFGALLRRVAKTAH